MTATATRAGVKPATTRPKDPSRIARGHAGMAARWGPEPRIVRLDALSDPMRRVVAALIAAARAEVERAAREEASTAIGAPVEAKEARRAAGRPIPA